jgi:glycosyltransferase involved in cell wall biosynthesis
MKILYYYWSQFNDVENKGGGVRVYLENIIGKMRSDKNIEIFTLNSGLSYDLKKQCYIEELKQNSAIKQFEIINSPMMSPSHNSFHNQQTYLEDTLIRDLFLNFIDQYGPFDIIHIHSMEGITLKTLELKDRYPDTKFYLSVHNYHCFCPQVNLWKNELGRCTFNNNGEDCTNCIPYLVSPSKVKKLYLLSTRLKRMGINPDSRFYGLIFKTGIFFYKKLAFMIRKLRTVHQNNDISFDLSAESTPNVHASNGVAAPESLNVFNQYRKKNIVYINQYIDKVFPVSNRVNAICKGFGVKEDKLKTLYIGTKFALDQSFESHANLSSDYTRIAFIGYMRKDKGFYYFLDQLESMPASLSEKLEVVIASRIAPGDGYSRIQKLKSKFKTIIFHDGYTHDNIKEILEGVHLGIVPVLWEDNLPQVAIEFKALGIPVLASKLGGASELSSSELFKFDVDIPGSLNAKIKELTADKSDLNDYWKYQNKLKTVDEHIDELMEYYEEKK